MKKIVLVLLFLFCMSLVTAQTTIYAENDLSIYSMDIFDNKVYLTGNLSYYNMSGFGYYNVLTGTFTNQSALYPTGTILQPWILSDAAIPTDVTLNYDRSSHFISSSYETLCVRYPSFSVHYLYCYRYSPTLNKWVLILNYNGGADVFYYGQQHINGAANYYMYNIIGSDGNHQIYNKTSGTLLQVAGTGAVILKQTSLDSDNRMKGITTAQTYTFIPNTTGTVQFTNLSNTGLTGQYIHDGWTDEETFYILTHDVNLATPKIFKSVDEGETFTEVISSDCSDIQSLNNIRFSDIDCSSNSNCFIGATYNTTILQKPLLIEFDGVSCRQDTDLILDLSELVNLNRTVASVTYDATEGLYYFGGFNLFGVIAETLTIFSIDNNTFGANQCIKQGDLYYLCTNSFYRDIAGVPGFVCNLDDYNLCEDDCLQFVYNVNTTELNSYSDAKECYYFEQKYSEGFLVDCDDYPQWLQDFFSDTCSADSFQIIPYSTCENTNINSYVATNDTYYIYGQCIGNYTSVINRDECFVTNLSICADNAHVKTCTYDIDGEYLYWNDTQTCMTGLNMNCVAGKCQYVTPSCFADSDCESDERCDIHGGLCVSGANDDDSDFSISWIPLSVRYILLIVISFLCLMFPMFMGGREGVLAGLAFSSVVVIALTIIFGLSIIIPVVYVVLAAGVFAAIIKGLFAGGGG